MPRPALATLVRLADAGEVFHVTDVETTGLSPHDSRVIELATVTLRGGVIVDRFSTLIDPGVPIPGRITELTGISGAMLEGAPAPAVALRRWQDFLGPGGHFVAHNAGFDWGFLSAEFEREGLEWPFRRRFCTVELARHCLPELRRHKLEHLIAHFGIEVSDRHRALADVEATAEVFMRFVTQLGAAAERRVPAATGARELSATAWDDLLARLRERSVTTAALLEQHGALAGWEPDGAVVVAITPVYKDHLEGGRGKTALVEEVLRELLGEDAYLRLEGRRG